MVSASDALDTGEMSTKRELQTHGRSIGEASLSPSLEEACADDATVDSTEGVLVNVYVPELKIQRRVLIDPDETLWVAKILFLSSIERELRDGLNYGFYLPPAAGRPGCFLNEEQTLRDWPDVLTAPVGLLEFAHKRRLIRSAMSLNVRKLRLLHGQSQLKQFMEMVKTSRLDKLQKCLDKGLDPNFQDAESGETPMTKACTQEDASRILLILVGGGAHLDFRNRHSFTPLHVAAVHGNLDAVKTLIELGASVESKDKKGLPPLYHVAAARGGSPECAQLLLREHAMIGYRDENGYTELHQACKNGNSSVVDLLAFYGADLNAQSCGGGTALHLCVANNEISCLKILLMRGANPCLENLLHQVPLHVAIVMGHKEAADVLNQHSESSLRPFTDQPAYNLRRPRDAAFRASVVARQLGPESRRLSVSALQLHTAASSSSSSSSMAAGSRPSLSASHRDQLSRSCYIPSSAADVLDGGFRGCGSLEDDEYSSSSDLWSLSARSDLGHLSLYLPGHRRTAVSDVEDVMSVSDNFWCRRGTEKETGPSDGRVMFRQKSNTAPRGGAPPSFRRLTLNGAFCSDEAATRHADIACSPVEPARTVVLTKGRKGFGFVLRGAKADQLRKMNDQFFPSEKMPALQYLDSVEKGSIADKAGLKAGDFIVELNGIDVSCSCHEDVVQLIKRSGDVIALKVVTMSASKLGWQSPSGMPTAADTTALVSGSATVGQGSRDAGADPRSTALISHEQPQSASRSEREEESHVLEQLDDTLANYDSQSTSSSTHAGCSGFDVSSVSVDAAAAAVLPLSSVASQPANGTRGVTAASRVPPPQLPLLQRSQSSGSGASMAAVAAAIAAAAAQPAQKVASIRARPASRLITAAAELEGMLSTSWHAGSRAGTGASTGRDGGSGPQPTSTPDAHHPPPPPPPLPPPPLTAVQGPASRSPTLKRLSSDPAAVAGGTPAIESPSADAGGGRVQVVVAPESTVVPERGSNSQRPASGPIERSRPEIVPLVLDATVATFSVGNGSDFNTFKGPVPVLSAVDGQSSDLYRQQLQRQLPHRLPRRPLSISPLASPDREHIGVFQRSDDARGERGVAGDPTGHSHSAPAVRRYMSQPSQPTAAPVAVPPADLHRSSSAAAVDGLSSVVGATGNALTSDDLSGSQNSINSSGSSSSFADAIRRAASAVRSSSGKACGSGSSGTGSPLSDQPTVVVAASGSRSPASVHQATPVAQKPAPPARAGVPPPLCKDVTIDGNSRVHRTRTSSGSASTASSASALCKSSVDRVGEANNARLLDAAACPSEGLTGASLQSGRDADLASISTPTVALIQQSPAAALKLQQSSLPSAAAASSAPKKVGISTVVGTKANNKSVSASSSGGGGVHDVVSARAKSDLKVQNQGAASTVAPLLSVQQVAGDVERHRDVCNGSSAAAVRTFAGEASALSVKGLRTAFESCVSGSVSASVSSGSHLSSSSGTAELPRLRPAGSSPDSDCATSATTSVRQPLQANGQDPAASASAVAIGDGSTKGPPPPPPAKRVLVKTEHIRPATDDRLTAASAITPILPPPPMFNGLAHSVADAGVTVQPKSWRQQQQHVQAKEIAVNKTAQPSQSDLHEQRHPATSSTTATEADVGQSHPSGQQQHHRHHHRHHRHEEERLQTSTSQQQQSSSAASVSLSGGSWRPFMDKHVEVWSVDDVADWLDSVGLSEYRRAFVDNCIEGEALVNLTRSEFKELGIDKVGHRVKFEREVLKLMAVSSV